MPDDDAMTITERRKYLKKMDTRYRTADRSDRGRLLDAMEAVTGLHRKSLLRLLHGETLERTPRRRQRSRSYGPAVDDAIRVIAESLDFICAERLTPSLLGTAQHLAQFGELQLTPELEEQLATISCSTVQRVLSRLSQDRPRLPRRGPDHANAIRKGVPMERLPWNTTVPGSCETDLVHHCGSSASGTYVHTLQMIDIATGWSERVGVLGRSQEAMEGGFERIQQRIPFPIRKLHPDNGSEFFNDHLVRYWGASIPGLQLSRSRPYQKNDNRFVEQKNDTLVRAYLGNTRLDTPEQCAALNALYDQMWVYYNLFQPVLHLTEKEVVGDRVRRRWDQAATPYQRLVRSEVLSEERAEWLAMLYAQTNPRQLRQAIYTAIPQLWEPPVGAITGRDAA